MNVLVIPEDFRKDQYMLKPLTEALLRHVGQNRAKVRVCQDPLLGGVGEALKWERLEEIIERYNWQIDLFLLCVDRDGQSGRRETLNNLEQSAREKVRTGHVFLAENAWQELEVWVLAGHNLLPGWQWREIREEIDPKERYFVPLVAERGLQDTPGEGRKILAEEAASHYSRIRQRCSEVEELEARVQAWIGV